MADQLRPPPVDVGMVTPVLSAYRQVAGQICPGERLPSEASLAHLFGVSRGTVREALRVLSAQHLVETRRR